MGYFRFGTLGHLSFLWCGLICNAIVSACILLGGGAVVNSLTGMNEYAALLLIPIGVAAYVSLGGLRATFISDATHTLVLLGFLLCFAFATFASSAKIGSPSEFAEMLTQVAKTTPVGGNYQGSYLTFRSRGGGIFAVQSIITGFGLVNCDQAYWSRAIAAKPDITARAYMIGGIAWFSIPFTMGTTLGLGARALSIYPDFPTLSTGDISAGLAAVAAGSYLLGRAGAVLMLLMVFLSVTSSLAGELIATSTLISYDIYKHYIRPKATAKEIVLAAQIAVFGWAIFAGGLACIFKAVGITMGWLFNFLGVATASGVVPIALSFTWTKLNTAGAVGGSMGGMALALVVWLAMAKGYAGEITVTTLSSQWVSFTGNVAAIAGGGIIAIVCSLIWPARFNWNVTRTRHTLDDSEVSSEVSSETVDIVEEDSSKDPEKGPEKTALSTPRTSIPLQEQPADYIPLPEEYYGIDIPRLHQIFKKYCVLFLITTSIVTFIIPVPLAGAPYIFSHKFFTGFVAIMIIWLFTAVFLVVFLPLIESRRELYKLTVDLFRGGKSRGEIYNN
jgi:Na+/proline symporter